MIYKDVFQEVLLYGRKIWVVTDPMMKVLEGFHFSMTRNITGMMVRRRDGGDREWALVEPAL